MAIGLCAVWSARGEQRIGTPPRGHGPRRLLCFFVFRIGPFRIDELVAVR